MRKGTLSTFFLILVLIIGLSLLLYPSFSDWWNSWHQMDSIVRYAEDVSNMNEERYSQILDSAREYNSLLLDRPNEYLLTEELQERYHEELNSSGNGIMGYIEIPQINVRLPIYHGTAETVLSVGIGHLDWTSLPTGGESTHCVISGHRGLPSARLFTDLDKIVLGDLFYLHVLGEELTYEVDQILVVEPNETQELLIQEGKDLVTMVTCTPYGINSHRLLIRGHRVANEEQAVVVRVTSDAIRVEPMVVAVIIFFPMLLSCVLLVLAADGIRKIRRKKRNK